MSSRFHVSFLLSSTELVDQLLLSHYSTWEILDPSLKSTTTTLQLHMQTGIQFLMLIKHINISMAKLRFHKQNIMVRLELVHTEYKIRANLKSLINQQSTSCALHLTICWFRFQIYLYVNRPKCLTFYLSYGHLWHWKCLCEPVHLRQF